MNSLRMCEDEIYVTCVCGSLVNESDMTQHIEDCLKEDFIRNATSLRIRKVSEHTEQSCKVRHVCGKCIRCGHPMYKDEGTLITFYPSIPDSVLMCCKYRDKSGNQQNMKESSCKMCKLPKDFHKHRPESENQIMNCIDNIKTIVRSVSENGRKYKSRQKQAIVSKFLGCVNCTKEFTLSEDAPEHEHSVEYYEIPSRSACKVFHVALLPNYNIEDEDSCYNSYSLLLQILDKSTPKMAVAVQTDLPTTSEVGVQVKILGVYPEEVQKLLATGKDVYDIPKFDPAAEAAFKSHLSTLIACKHCSRTFSPDRIQKHMSCCIERPRTSIRECTTPKGGEISR